MSDAPTPPQVEPLLPHLSYALRALDERIRQAQAERDAFVSALCPAGYKVIGRPDGAYLLMRVVPPAKDGE